MIAREGISPTHPLHACGLRIKRAGKYIDEVEALIRGFESQCEDLVIANSVTKAGFGFPAVPQDLPLAISDATHNLRAALDYLVYALAILDSGQIQDGTQFPLEPTNAGFDAAVDRFLRGVSQSHRDAIESLQPYHGAAWAQNLKDISNRDKHRHLIGIHKGKEIGIWIHSPQGDGKALPSGDKVQVDANHTILIELPDRKLWVAHTLYEIQAAAMDALNKFEVDFEVRR
jgi:hypothetical protein